MLNRWVLITEKGKDFGKFAKVLSKVGADSYRVLLKDTEIRTIVNASFLKKVGL